MPENPCQHVWRGVSGEMTKVARWIVLEQCENCGDYRDQVIRPDTNHPNAEVNNDGLSEQV